MPHLSTPCGKLSLPCAKLNNKFVQHTKTLPQVNRRRVSGKIKL